MRGAVLFILGMTIGAFVARPLAQERAVVGLNHVSVSVKDFDVAIRFYTGTLGFREAYRMNRPDGSPRLAYLQINKTTFLEVQPATPDLPPGLTHFAVEVPTLTTAIQQLRTHQVAAPDPALTPAKALSTRITAPDGVPVEIMEFGPDSLQRKAINSWKD